MTFQEGSPMERVEATKKDAKNSKELSEGMSSVALLEVLTRALTVIEGRASQSSKEKELKGSIQWILKTVNDYTENGVGSNYDRKLVLRTKKWHRLSSRENETDDLDSASGKIVLVPGLREDESVERNEHLIQHPYIDIADLRTLFNEQEWKEIVRGNYSER